MNKLTSYAIGETGPAGGKVFYSTDGGLHGLEVAPEDQISAPWGCDGTRINGADGTTVGTGAQNTVDILACCTDTEIAASCAATYEVNGFDDWFLPSKGELDLLYQEKAIVSVFADPYYWSSTEYDGKLAWFQSFSNGLHYVDFRIDALRVRAVRAF
ncbi:MAG: DUF1566 domain-containing protein [Gammaproteobacteria bacterium]